MRILHFADVHIGVENYARTNPETGLSTRLHDFLDTFDELVDYAIESGVPSRPILRRRLQEPRPVPNPAARVRQNA